jgi:transposase
MTEHKRGTDHAVNRSGGRISVPPRAREAYLLWKQGMTPKEIGTKFGVSRKTVTDWVRKCHEEEKDKRLSNS